MTKEKFLLESDVNILNYFVTEVMDGQGNESIEIILKVGPTQEEIEEDPTGNFCGYEIMLSKENIKHLLSEIKKAEKKRG